MRSALLKKRRASATTWPSLICCAGSTPHSRSTVSGECARSQLEFRLRRRGPDHEEFAGIAGRLRDAHEIGRRTHVVGARRAARFVAHVVGRVIGMHGLLLRICGIEIDDAGFAVIDPDDRV